MMFYIQIHFSLLFYPSENSNVLTFPFKKTKLTTIRLMKRESQASEVYEDVIDGIGPPNKTVTDNARVCKYSKWITINRRFCIETGLTVPHHQHQITVNVKVGYLSLRF